jgi:hypothetical protein
MKIKRPKFQLNCEIYNFVPQKYADRSKNFKAFLMHATKMFRLGGKKNREKPTCVGYTILKT